MQEGSTPSFGLTYNRKQGSGNRQTMVNSLTAANYCRFAIYAEEMLCDNGIMFKR
jgi:hypothetical protein